MSVQNDFIRQLQEHLKALRLYTGEIDGIAGDKTKKAYEQFLAKTADCAINCTPKGEEGGLKLPWGKKVSQTFKERVQWIADDLLMPAKGAGWIMGVSAFETGETFSPSVKNLAGSSGTGLIQFMSFTAKSMGTTVEALAKMTAEDQLNYVYKYFAPYKGRLNTLGDVYLAVLYPKAMAMADSATVWVKGKEGLLYSQNAGLDKNKDDIITRQEIVSLVEAKYKKGFDPLYFG